MRAFAMTGRHHAQRWSRRFVLLTAACAVLMAHVGTTQVVLEGNAGPYPVRVFIRPPGVVPAQVPIVVRILDGAATRVTVRAAQWNVGTTGAPAAEDATPVAGDKGTFAHDLWIMTSSTYSIHVYVEGDRGQGTLLVPMQSVATKTLGMGRATGGILIFLGVLLFIGVLTLAGASAREGSLPPGELPDTARVRAGRIAMASSAVIVALALFGGSRWWNSEERAYRRGLYRPYRVHTIIQDNGDARTLTLAVTESLFVSGRQLPLLPDHGKLMHMFLIDVGGASVVAHLHPLRTAPDSFVTAVPPLPAGRYFLFADVVHQSGIQRTFVDTVDVPALFARGPAADATRPGTPAGRGRADAAASASGTATTDADDAWRATTPAAVGDSAPLPGGGTITLTLDGVAQTDRDLRLAFAVRNANGTPAALEPYMGMAGHAMLMRTDGRVFLHLHPMGTANMASQAQLLRRERGDTARLDSATIAAAIAREESSAASAMHTMHTTPGSLAFPTSFPEPGTYRVFVQFKRAGQVETASFTIPVGT